MYSGEALERRLRQATVLLNHQTFSAVVDQLRHALGGRGQKSPAHRYRASLESIIKDLKDSNTRTEEDFLAVGGKLIEFSTAAHEISSGMTALSQMISGESGRHAALVLTRVLEQLHRIKAHLEASGEALARVCESARRIRGAFGDFRDTVSVFRVLGSLTRIETARLGNAGAEFGNLADEVRSLTQAIETSGQGILEASSRLHQKMQAAISQISVVRAGAFHELPALLDEVNASLSSLEERHARAHEASCCQAAGYSQVSAAVEELVNAIQFHDITRQKIEHVADALRPIAAASHLRGDAGMQLKLQSAQISDAERVFSASVGRIEHSLEGIEQRVAGMAGECGSLFGFSDDERGSFFLQMENRFAAILRILRTCGEADASIESALGGLAQSVAHMRESAAEVRDIDLRLRRMAINAAIRATQIGAAGSALDVLAGVMQRLARNSSGITDQVTAALDAMAGATSGLEDRTDPASNAVDELLAEMRRTILELHSASESSFSRLHEIAKLSAGLHDGVQSLRAGFSASAVFAEVAQRARVALDRIAEQAEYARFPDAQPPQAPCLDDFAHRYTMQSERDVHQAVINAGAPAPMEPVIAAAAPVSGEENELGDNVELF